VNPQSETETFVALKLSIDNWRWADVPFYVRTGKRLATGFNYRFYPSFRQAREILDSGLIGELDHVRSYGGYTATSHNQPWVHDASTVGGGALRDIGIHLLDLTREQAEVWRQIEGVARARYDVGQGSQQDVLRVQVELTRVGQALAEQEAEGSIRLAEINRLLGRAAEAALVPSAALQGVPETASLPAELARLSPLSPERSAALIGIDRARLAVELAKKEYRPDFNAQGGYMNRGGLDPMWQAGVSVTLPLNRKRRASGVAEAEALLSAARSRLDAVELQLRLRTQERLAQLAAARKVATLYSEGIVPQDRMSVEAAIASYQSGRLPFITVLEALTTLYGDRSTLVRLLAGQARIRASLDEASLEATSDLPGMDPAAIAAASRVAGMNTSGTTSGAMGSMSR